MEATGVQSFVTGSKMSALRTPTPQSACPPNAKIRPSGSATAALQNILVTLLGTEVKFPVLGFQRSADVPPFDGGPSQERTFPSRVTTILIATIGQLNGAVHEPTNAGSFVLSTVTVTGEDVVRLPAPSRAIAVTVCEPLEPADVFHVMVKGAAVISVPKAAPSI